MNDLYDLFTLQEQAPAAAEYQPAAKEDWIAMKQAERKAAFEKIDTTVQKMQGSGEILQSYLDVQARFDRYSVSNAILITAQMPEATQLRTFEDWKDAGQTLNKGAHAITLLEPGREYQRKDGSTGMNYNIKKVFDVSLTTGPYREFLKVPRDARALLKALIADANCKMAISDELWAEWSKTGSVVSDDAAVISCRHVIIEQ